MVEAIWSVRVRRAATVALALAMAAFLGLCTSARAEGTPDISAAVSSSSTLYGPPVEVRMSATNPDTEDGYNLSFRVVLPPGVKYLDGGGVTPTQISDRPTTGETTLIFSNISDLSPNSTREATFKVEYSDVLYEVGDSFPVAVQAFVNDDPRFIPKFDADGEPEGPSETSFTGNSDEVVGTQTLKALDVNIAELSHEGEILRGVHDHQVEYTLSVTNNGVNPTKETKLDAYLPAGLEFLGCGGPGMDNTKDAPTNEGSAEEYVGSGPIESSVLVGCVAPESVETEEVDPDGAGPLLKDVYTHVVWFVDTLGDGETKTFPFWAAVPIRANTNTFTGVRPTALSGGQAANLDNNSGAEVVDETPLRTYAAASGIYQGKEPIPATDAEELLRTAEDWVVRKGGPKTLAQGAISKWTLTFETSEYKFVNDATITDTLPDGLCPLGSKNFTSKNDAPDSECEKVVGEEPTAEYASATEHLDGSWTLTWDKVSFPALSHLGVNDKLTLEFPTRTRTHYQESEVPQSPILTNDSVVNKVETSASGFARCTEGLPDCSDSEASDPRIDHDGVDGSTIFDASAAEQVAGGATIDKEVAVSGANCLAATYTEAVPHYQPGDRICWKIRVEFPSTLDTSPQAIADYLPPGTTYVPGSEAKTPEDNVIAEVDDTESGDGLLTWTITGGTVPAGKPHVLERVFATTVAPLGTVVNGDLKGNLLKFASKNTPGETIPQRDEANFIIDTPVLDLVKGVERVIRGGKTVVGPNGKDVDGGTVVAEDVVEYRIDVTNEGSAPGWNVSLSSVLEDGITCADVLFVSHTGGCGGNQVDWAEPSTLAPGATETYAYAVKMPGWVEPGKRFDDHAGIISYQSSTNEEPVPGFFTYYPAENIGGAGPANAPAADDTSWVQTPGLQFTKTRTTGVEDAGNNAESQATIGEPVHYKVKLVVPEGTTVYGGEFTDFAGSARHTELVSTSAKLNEGALPGGFLTAEDPFESGLTVTFPGAYTNEAGTGDDVFEFTISTKVADNANNSRLSPKETITNTAHFDWNEEGGTPHKESASVKTTIVEPNIAVSKTDNDADKKVSAGQSVDYTITASNVNGTRVSSAHDLILVDKVPAGLTLALPIADEGEWDALERTITWKVGALTPGQEVQRKYTATVDIPAIANQVFTNKARLTATSLIGAIEGERGPGSPIETGYVANAEDTVSLGDATLTKSVDPLSATIGEEVTYTTEVEFPPHVEYYDATVIDTLPDGLVYDETVEVTCNGGQPCEASTLPLLTELGEEAQPDGSTEVAWYTEFIPAFPEPRSYEITYTAHVADKYVPEGTKVLSGQTLTNVADTFYNGEDTIGEAPKSIPDPSEFSGGSNADEAEVDVVEPKLAIDKQIKVGSGAFGDGPTPAHSDDQLTYRLIVENKGDSPAHDVEVTDAIDPVAVKNVQVVPQEGLTVASPWSEVTDAMTLLIKGPIPAGGKYTVEYSAEFVAASQLKDGQKVLNTAAVPLYFGASKEEREDNPGHVYRKYADGSDKTEAVLDFPTLAIEKTTGLGGEPDTGDAEVLQEFPWRIVAANSSPTAGATAVEVEDVLPPNWDYVPGSTTLDGVGAVDPAVAEEPGGDRLKWTISALGPEEDVVIAFKATPQVAAAENPGTGAQANVNTARVTGATDEAGNTGNEDGQYEAGPDAATATLLVPDLKVFKTPDGGEATAGTASSFAVKVENAGTGTARDIDVVDVLPKGIAYTANAASAAPPAGFSETGVTAGPGSGETTVKWRINSLSAGQSVTVTVPVAIEADVPEGATLTNAATASSKETPDPVENKGTLDVGAEADMSIEKTGAATYTAGDEYSWNLRVRNLGPSDAQGVTVSDPLPAGTSFVSASSPCGPSGAEVTCSLGKVAPGFDETYEVTVEVDADTTTSPLDNTAEVSTTTDDPKSENDTSTFGPTASPLADVSVVKTANPTAILKGHQTTFTVTVHNAGPSVARDVTLDDPLPAGLAYVSVVGSGCTEASGTVECAIGDLAPGGEETIEITVKGTLDGVITNTATAATTTPEPPGGGNPNSDSAEVEVGPVAELGVVKEGPATVAADGQLTWTLTVTNNGPDEGTGVTIVDTLPAGTVFVAADPGCSEASGTVTCDVGALAPTASAERQITVTVPRALADTTLVNSAVVHGDQGDDEPENDSDEAETKVGPSADVSVVKTGPSRVNANGTIAWTLAVSNAGPSTATGVRLADSLPPGVTLSSAVPTQGSCAPSATGVECALGTLASGGAAQVQVVAHVPPSLEGSTLLNRAGVAAEEPDPNPGNNESDATAVVDPPAPSDYDLAIAKTIDRPSRPALGEVLRYSITVSNRGPATATGLKITDSLPGSVEYVSASLPGGKCAESKAVVTCGLASLPAGAEKTATVAVRLMRGGPLRNTATVAGAVADENAANNRSTARVKVSEPPAQLRVSKVRLGGGAAEPGERLRFRIRVRNVSDNAAANAMVCDRLPASMTFAKLRGARLYRGDACWSIEMLPGGASRTYRLAARIDGGLAGGRVRNVAFLKADNAPARRGVAGVRVGSDGAGRGGGVTG